MPFERARVLLRYRIKGRGIESSVIRLARPYEGKPRERDCLQPPWCFAQDPMAVCVVDPKHLDTWRPILIEAGPYT